MSEIKCPSGCPDAPWSIELRGVYDGTAYWHCPACGANWHRFPIGTRDRVRAAVERVWRQGT